MKAGIRGLVISLCLAACSAPPTVGPTELPWMAPSRPAAPPAAEPPAQASPAPTSTPVPSTTAAPSPTPLAELIERDALAAHLEALQAAADAHGGNRATGTPGHAASIAHVAAALLAAGYHVEQVRFEAGTVRGVNVLAERPGGAKAHEVVVLGAHLDSDPIGPGLNDNGSGVAGLLEIAARLAESSPPERTVRFAFWDAEERGAHGSRAYLAALSPEDRARIVAYLNFDMIGSPNALRLVYAEADAPAGSEAITACFAAHFERARLAWEPIDLRGASDHGPFIAAGIPTGGLFSGGIEPVTDAQAARFGARAGVPADPCSHRPCDTVENVDLDTLEEMVRAAAQVLAELAGAP